MKKLYSTIMMLAMIVAALNITSCSSSDDDDSGDSSNIVFSITIDGNKKAYDSSYMDFMDLTGRWENTSILIGTDIGDFRLKYPSGTTFSSFTSGYSSFENDAEKITIGVSSSRPCTYVSGSATVLSNDGNNMKIRFSNYKFSWNQTREIIFDGTLNIVLLN